MSFERSIVCIETSRYVPDRDWPMNLGHRRSRAHWLFQCTRQHQSMLSKDQVLRELGGPREHYGIVYGFCCCARYKGSQMQTPPARIAKIKLCMTYFVERALCRVETENFLPEKLMVLVGLGDPVTKALTADPIRALTARPLATRV